MKTVYRTVVPILVVSMGLLGGCRKAEEAAMEAVDEVESVATDAVEAVEGAASDLASAVGEGFATAANKAASLLHDVEGGGEVLRNVTDFFSSANKSLKSVTDGATANTALTELNKLSGSLDGWSTALAGLPAEAKSAVVAVIEQGIDALKTVANKVMALPGVADVLQAKVDEMMSKLQSYVG